MVEWQKRRLNRTMQYGNFSQKQTADDDWSMFKSYYVVWKQICLNYAVSERKCLNRTMQYGNVKKVI